MDRKIINTALWRERAKWFRAAIFGLTVKARGGRGPAGSGPGALGPGPG